MSDLSLKLSLAALGGRSIGNAPLFVFTNGSLPVNSSYTGNGGLGTRVSSSALMVQSVADTARFDYSLTSAGTALGVLVERASTNLLLQSRAFDNASWTPNGTTVVANSATGPSGATAELVYPAASGANKWVGQIVAMSGTSPYTSSVYAKAAGVNWLSVLDHGGSAFVAWFDLQNGVLGTVSSGFTATITPAGNGFYRCTVSGTAVVGNAYSAFWTLSDGNNLSSVTANSTNGILFSDAQYETGVATTPIPTTTAQVTRTADALVLTIPAGVANIKFTFDDNNTQTVAVSAGAYAVPTTLNRARIKSVIAV